MPAGLVGDKVTATDKAIADRASAYWVSLELRPGRRCLIHLTNP
jgi:hypothetical protein